MGMTCFSLRKWFIDGHVAANDMEMIKERLTKFLLGEDMSGGGKGVSYTLALSNSIMNLADQNARLWMETGVAGRVRPFRIKIRNVNVLKPPCLMKRSLENCILAIDKSGSLLQQVSHHPMIVVCHCEGKGQKFWGYGNLKSKYRGRLIQLNPVGGLTLKFDDGEVFSGVQGIVQDKRGKTASTLIGK
ncbi:oxysterol-binding protein [Tanacetum coccineum]|uniref:Oxysterol-binding protein n=1 Tax=Tanacetum coccineum TaxID=301880 RepID=A0ABQ5G8L8_9ASTR